jgi:hypothetical protein
MPVIEIIEMPADNIRRLAMSMDQSASPLFAATDNDNLCIIDIGKLFFMDIDDAAQLAVLISSSLDTCDTLMGSRKSEILRRSDIDAR